MGPRPGTTDFMSVKTLLFSLLKGMVEVEPLGSLPRPLSLCLVLVNTRGPENAGASVGRFRGRLLCENIMLLPMSCSRVYYPPR